MIPWSIAQRFLCPWDFPGKNTGVGCHLLLQGIFLTQGSNEPTSPALTGGFLFNTQKWIVQGDTRADKARDFIGKWHPGGEQQSKGTQEHYSCWLKDRISSFPKGYLITFRPKFTYLIHTNNIQPWQTSFPIWNQSVVPCPVLTVASWPAYTFLKKQVRWSGIPISFRIFHSLLWSTQSKALA